MTEPCACGGCDCGCCEGTEPITPRIIENRPGLDALAYRIGTHSTFLETMKARLSSHDFPALGGLTTRDGGDPSIALLDAWAVVGDVLTFYQERIANEGYLRTATERRSVLELARLVGYAPRPGVASSVYLAYLLDEKPKPAVAPGSPVTPVSTSEDEPETVVPAGARAQSVPAGPGETQQSFETSEDVTARAAWNNLQVRLTRPQTFETFAQSDPQSLYLKGIATQLKVNDPLLIGSGGTPQLYRVRSVETDPPRDRTRVTVELWLSGANAPTLSAVSKITGLSNVLATLGKPPLVQPRNSRRLDRDVSKLLGPGSDLKARLLSVARPELRSSLYQAWANVPAAPAPTLEVYALRARAAVFGNNAPVKVLSAKPQDDGTVTFSTTEWTLTKNDFQGLPHPTEDPNVVWLDAAYPQIASQSWIVLLRPAANGVPQRVITRVEGTGDQSRADYGIAAKVTRVALREPWLDLEGNDRDDFATVRGTAVFAQSEPLELVEEPISLPVSGGDLELAGLYDGLQPGRWLIVSGERVDIGQLDDQGNVAVPVPGVPAAELAMVAGVSQDVSRRATPISTEGNGAAGTGQDEPLPGERTHTTLTLATPLAYRYKRDTLTIYGNVAHATHGETRFEVLGGGNAAKALQSFTLKQPPLTWISAPTPSGVDSTLTVRVNDVRWHLAESLAGLGPADRSYILRTDDGGQTAVVFGNGERGARLPTGSENVRAVYRSGIGRVGNVNAGRITQLATRPLGVKGVTNPIPSTGGADRESRDQARRNAPLALLALDRLVSVQDYEDFTRTFAGVGKASAVPLSDGRVRLVHVTLAGEDDVPIREDSDLFLNLEAALLRFGDPLQPLRLAVRQRAFLVVQAEVQLLADYLWEAVEPKIRAAMLDAFGFTRRGLGQDALLSQVYATIQGVRGVDFVDVTVFASQDPEDLSAGLDKGEPPVLSKLKTATTALPQPRLRARLARVDEQGKIVPAQLLYLAPEAPDTLILKERKS
jgi:hypothetical protein